MCPHDDAYTILSLIPWEVVHREIKEQLQCPDRLKILEPLVSLVVDQSAKDTSPSKGRHWPEMFALLLRSGMFDFLEVILLIPLPEREEGNYPVIARCKVDAVTCFMRCFEQMKRREMELVTPKIKDVLTELVRDEENVPLPLQRQAQDALLTLRRSVLRVIVCNWGISKLTRLLFIRVLPGDLFLRIF